MHISAFIIENYKSFKTTDWTTLDPHMNIFIGENNSGKSAALESLSLNFRNNPHRTLETIPQMGNSIESSSSIKIKFTIPQKEFLSGIRSLKKELWLFEPTSAKGNNENFKLWFQNFIKEQQFEGTIKIGSNKEDNPSELIDSLNKYPYAATSKEPIHWIIPSSHINDAVNNDWSNVSLGRTTGHRSNEVTNIFFNKLKKQIYIFNAERFNIGICPIAPSLNLDSNARNLPAVLHYLHSSMPYLFEQYLTNVKRVLPFIKHITAAPISANEVEIKIWTHDIKSNRSDLAISLNQCGTGVSQVLAILFTSTLNFEKNILIIDEPNSFLHPRATRQLFEIFKENPNNQYIITSHSPEVISASNTNRIFTVKNIDNCSTIISSIKNVDTINSVFKEIGVGLQDLFGYDKVLWVEGSTEELFFPNLIDKTKHPHLVILQVKNTGDFDGKKANLIFDLYKKFSEQEFIMPPTVGFIFDRENKSEKEIEDIQRMGAGKVQFLEKNMFESYLIDLECLEKELSEITKSQISQDQIMSSIQHPDIKSKFKLKDDVTWADLDFSRISAASFLQTLYAHFCEPGFEYRKVFHSVSLAKRVLREKPEKFHEIKEKIDLLLKQQ